MQLIAEAYHLLRHTAGYEPSQIAEISRTWNTGRLNSYLIEVTAEVLAHTDSSTGLPFVDIVADSAGQKGTGRWTVQTALDRDARLVRVFGRPLAHRRSRRCTHGGLVRPAG
ncbi:hypothetical protein [Streptomyces sp. NBC_00353]